MPLSQIVKIFQLHRGWKPGAVSERVLHMLNKAKSKRYAVEEIKSTRRLKKLVENKPTLKISKRNGQYCIELQPNSENPEESNRQYTPLIYKIESENNKDKIKKQGRLQRRLTRAAIKDVWSYPYHPEICETCSKAHNEATCVMPLNEKDTLKQEEERDTINSCSCEDEKVSSSCSSSEVDWEMHFTPPMMRYRASRRESADLFVV